MSEAELMGFLSVGAIFARLGGRPVPAMLEVV